jgi:ankyrin repeat protein
MEAAKSDGEAKAITPTPVATTNEQANSDLKEAAKSDGEAKAITPTPVATTNEQANTDLKEAAKSDGEAKAITPTPVATTNHQANLDLIDTAKSDGKAKAITATSVATTNEQANLDLLEAAKWDDEAKAVAALTQSGVDVNCRENCGNRNTSLIRAANKDSVKVARVLLADPRLKVNAADTMGLTALHHARDRTLNAIILSERTDIDWNAPNKAGLTPLLFKSRLPNVDTVSQVIEVKSVQLLARSMDGFTALHELAERESPFPHGFPKATPEKICNLVKVLFKFLEARGHNLVTFVNATDILNRSALHYLAEEGSVEMLKLLLEKCPGMSVTGVDCHGFTPLHLAVRRGHTAVVESLLPVPSMDANVAVTVNASNPSGLKPWEPGHLDLLRPDLFSKAPKEVPTAADLTPLHFAAMDGHTEIVDLLLKWEGIHVAPLDTKGLSPFDYSLQNGHSGVLKLLLQKLEKEGEPFTLCDKWLGPLDHYIQKGQFEIVKLLLEKGEPFTPVNCENQMSMFDNLLTVATEHNRKEIAVHLLDTLGLRTQPFAQSSTPSSSHESKLLAVAARENYFKIIRYVLKWHPEVNANASIVLVAHQDLVASPLHFAALGGHVEAVKELLLHHNLDVNAKDNKKRTPLLCAIKEHKLGVVKALCSDPANRLRATEEASDGRTPIQIATEANLKEIEKVLLERPEVKDFVDRLYRDRQVFVDAANALLVGAALIASVTFAGWLQPPLGYIPDYDFSQPFPAPPQTPESYAAVKNHETVKAFWVFNSLSFFFAIATVLAGADAALPNLRDDFIGRRVKSVERALIRATILLVISVVCVLGAFASAGFAALPPLLKYDTSMIITVFFGGTICMLTLAKIIWKLSTPIRMQFLKTSTTMTAGGHATGLP